MAGETSLKQVIQGMCGNDVELLQGVITSTSPLKIQVANDEKLTIGEAITYVPEHLTDYKVSALINGTSGSITLKNALKTGDKVHLLVLNHGKLYFVLDRI